MQQASDYFTHFEVCSLHDYDLSWKLEKIMVKMAFLLHKSHFSKKPFWTSNLDHSQILSQLSYERVLYL